MPDCPNFFGERHIIRTRTTDIRFVDCVACPTLHDSGWKGWRRIVLSFPDFVRFVAVDNADVFARRCSAQGYRNRLPDNDGFGSDLLCDGLSLVNVYSAGGACSTNQLISGDLPCGRDAGARAVLYGPLREFQQRAVAFIYQPGVPAIEDEPLCRHCLADSRDTNSSQRLVTRCSDVGDPGDILFARVHVLLVLQFEAPAASEKLDVTEAVAKIVYLQHRVMWRRRLLSLQDLLVLALITSAAIAAALVAILKVRVGAVSIPVWAIVLGTMSLAVGAALIRWFRSRTGGAGAALLIDESLTLEDRVATSRLIIERGGPSGAFEEALIEDTAARVADQRASSIVPFRTRRWYALLLVSAIGLSATLMIPARSLPVDQATATERSDIESAGVHLEQTATELEQLVPPGTDTASLAKEQAEIGRGFRRATATRAEALRRLSALEERIRRRHDDLSNTRADEIVTLADRRLGNTLATLSKPRSKKFESAGGQLAETGNAPPVDAKESSRKQAGAPVPDRAGKPPETSAEPSGKSGIANSRAESPTTGKPTNGNRSATGSQKQLQEPITAETNRNAGSVKESTRLDTTRKETAGEPAASAQTTPQKQDQPSPADSGAGVEKTPEKSGDGSKADSPSTPQVPPISPEALKAVPDSLVEQAAKALPKLSEELLRKAAELRANELSPADIEKLRKAAESLARDLDQIGQSQELQKALQEMARQVRPEQIDEVARELSNQEKLKQELEGAARLLSENRRAKEIVAGLAGELARAQDQKRQGDSNQQTAGKSNMQSDAGRSDDASSTSRRGGAGAEKSDVENGRLAGSGRESTLKGKLQQRAGGEYLYLESKAGTGAARAPYSTAYPRYRREAERSVQRSQVPPNLRSIVRKYFDAINPDAKRQ